MQGDTPRDANFCVCSWGCQGLIHRRCRTELRDGRRQSSIAGMWDDVESVFADGLGVATTAQLRAVMSRAEIVTAMRYGLIVRVWHGVYARPPLTTGIQLDALEVVTRTPLVACLNTAAAVYGFDTDPDGRLHVLDPGVRLRPSPNLMVHQRIGAPLAKVGGRLVTAPAWTAIELARTLRRGRALAVLDAALRSKTCTRDDLLEVVAEQKGRRGIVAVRELAELADPLPESPMESETRLVFIDGGLPKPELQHRFIDLYGKEWRGDFYWREANLVGEFDSEEFHANRLAFKRDRKKAARLQELGLTVMPIVVDDVRKTPFELVARVFHHLERARNAG